MKVNKELLLLAKQLVEENAENINSFEISIAPGCSFCGLGCSGIVG